MIPDIYLLRELMITAAAMGAAQVVRHLCPADDDMSQREAYRQFGETRVKNWLEDGAIKRYSLGNARNSKIIYRRSELLAAAAAEEAELIMVDGALQLKGKRIKLT